MTIAALIDQALRAQGIPILGVSVGTEGDRATWTVQFDPSATPAQKTQAASILSSVVVDGPAQRDADAKADLDSKVLKTLVIWLAGKFGIPPLQAKQELIAIYKGL